MELAVTRAGERGAYVIPQLLSRNRGLTDGFHQLLNSRVVEHRTRLVCLGETPSPRVRCLWALFTLTYLLTGRARASMQGATSPRHRAATPATTKLAT